MRTTAICPGSYDPATRGHIDIIERAARIFGEVYAAVCVNAEKAESGMFSAAERLRILKAATAHIPNVRCVVCRGLLAAFMRENGINTLVKGVRDASDFTYEYSLAEIMRNFDAGFDTVFIPASPSLAHISATYAREVVRYGCDPALALTHAAAHEAEIILKERSARGE